MAELTFRMPRPVTILTHQRVNGKENIRRQKIVPVALLIMAIIILIFLFYVWSRLMVVNLGYEISKANQKQRELIQINNQLRLEVATLRSPDRIEEFANLKLGLRPPKSEQIIILK